MTIFTLLISLLLFSCLAQTKKEFKLVPLPFEENALEPFISKETVSIHYNKHHAGYVKKLNIAAEKDKELFDFSISYMIRHADDYPQNIINLASQIFNHEFYWECIKPMNIAKETEKTEEETEEKTEETEQKTEENKDKSVYGISDSLLKSIKRVFGSFDKFKKEFTNRAKKHFGSGWLWLVA
eukprot:239398_1